MKGKGNTEIKTPIWEQKIDFNPRGIGGANERTICLCCAHKAGHELAGFVKNKEAGEIVTKMFLTGAWLDFRPREPGWVQVKIGACERHIQNLQKMEEHIRSNGDIIEISRVILQCFLN